MRTVSTCFPVFNYIKLNTGKLPENIQSLFDDKLYQFIDDWRHPSFRTHMLGGTDEVWSASLNMSIRFTLSFDKDSDGIAVCVLRNIGDHDHTMRPPYLVY